MNIHQRLTHPVFVDGCWVCRVSTVTTSGVSKTNGADRDHEKRFNAEIKAYRDAVREGHDPEGSTFEAVRAARAFGDATGMAYTHENVAKVQADLAARRA